MHRYLRLDDACEKRDIVKWNKMETLLDKYNICPIVGVIPKCGDSMMDGYEPDPDFWRRVSSWSKKNWTIALHGYDHVFITEDGGINPVNKRSEFAGVPLEEQCEKIRKGIELFRMHGIAPKIFFAPAHTFDKNTLKALRRESNIRVISDTIANKPYRRWGFTFVPQQSGCVRKLPFDTVTFCYHPNTMTEADFKKLEDFIVSNRNAFEQFNIRETKRRFSLMDRILSEVYFIRRRWSR